MHPILFAVLLPRGLFGVLAALPGEGAMQGAREARMGLKQVLLVLQEVALHLRISAPVSISPDAFNCMCNKKGFGRNMSWP